jgi:signal peptidase I
MSEQASGESPATTTEPTGSTESTGPTGSDGPETTDIVQPERVERSRRYSSTRNTLEWVAVIVGAVVVALLIKTFVVQAFRIPSESMVTTLEMGDRVLVNKLSYDAHDLNRGDVIVFSRPEALPAGADEPKDLIKRVIGLPGDELVTRNGELYVNGRLLEEPYLPPGTPTNGIDQPLTVPEGQVLVLGDNRGNSSDGRVFGPIDQDSVIGRAFTIMWPPGRIGAL